MELIPAIDILGGQVVRLHKGRYDEVTVYSDDPPGQARAFYEAGARRLHVVDLDGAREGQPCNVDTIRAILAAAPLAVQVGGGIRDEASAERWLAAGADRLVLGTMAIKQPALAQRLCARFPGTVVAAIDGRGGQVAVEGWLETSGRPVDEVAAQVDSWGVAAILHTVIERDGTREGPDVEATAALQSRVRATVIASGGIGALAHLRALARAGVGAAGCGRARYAAPFLSLAWLGAIIGNCVSSPGHTCVLHEPACAPGIAARAPDPPAVRDRRVHGAGGQRGRAAAAMFAHSGGRSGGGRRHAHGPG
jgi:phosphoribosylformimino-5-aminoimidazole carboxamide ribotide isomerase